MVNRELELKFILTKRDAEKKWDYIKKTFSNKLCKPIYYTYADDFYSTTHGFIRIRASSDGYHLTYKEKDKDTIRDRKEVNVPLLNPLPAHDFLLALGYKLVGKCTGEGTLLILSEAIIAYYIVDNTHHIIEIELFNDKIVGQNIDEIFKTLTKKYKLDKLTPSDKSVYDLCVRY
jgi:predicted adenylyl cyclase CyaB